MRANEKAHVLKEYALALTNGEETRAKAIQSANGKWITRDEFANASA